MPLFTATVLYGETLWGTLCILAQRDGLGFAVVGAWQIRGLGIGYSSDLDLVFY